MKEIISITSASMGFDTERLQTIAQNLANVSTDGYKRVISVNQSGTSPFDQHMLAAETNNTSQTVADNRVGSLRTTNNPLDIAIEGTGFFEIRTNEGVKYTRSGIFQLDKSGQLVTHNGHVVMGERGPITLTTSTPVIDKDGQLFEKDKIVDKLKVVSFADVSQLKYLGDGIYDAASASPSEGTEINHVRQGFVESSNVSSMHEMVAMIETMRHFESMQKVVQSMGGMHDIVLNKLGQF